MIKRLVALGALAVLASQPLRPLVACGDVARVDSKTFTQLETIAASDSRAGKVDDHVRIAQALCSMPRPRKPEPRLSDAHGPSKVYFLYAKDAPAYLEGVVANGQWVVKEAFEGDIHGCCRSGHTWTPGKRAGLYVMLRVGEDRPGSDAGWVYATTTPEGRVTAAGKIASCVNCHRLAKNERLFGLAPIDAGSKKEMKETTK
jgi:hypothetical protein